NELRDAGPIEVRQFPRVVPALVHRSVHDYRSEQNDPMLAKVGLGSNGMCRFKRVFESERAFLWESCRAGARPGRARQSQGVAADLGGGLLGGSSTSSYRSGGGFGADLLEKLSSWCSTIPGRGCGSRWWPPGWFEHQLVPF